jgi:peptide/nickel transport system substrate-binding protein
MHSEPAGDFLPAGMLGHDPSVAPRRLGEVEAKARLQKAWKGAVWEKGFHFTMVVMDSPSILPLAQMLKKNVESLNPRFRVDVRAVPWSEFFVLMEAHKLPVLLGGQSADYPDPHNLIAPLFRTGDFFASRQSRSEGSVDSAARSMRRSSPGSERAALYRRVQRAAFDEAALVPICAAVRFRTQRTWVKGWKFNPLWPDSPFGSDFHALYKEE